jgi:hypothetical protein
MSKALKSGFCTLAFPTSWRHQPSLCLFNFMLCSIVSIENIVHSPLLSFILTLKSVISPSGFGGSLPVGPCLHALICLRRPITPAGERVTPSDLWEYRYTHQFKALCCLCACTLDGIYTESIIYQAFDGPYAGEFICGCASFKCGFLSTYTLLFNGD